MDNSVNNPPSKSPFWGFLKEATSDGEFTSTSRLISLICVPLLTLIPIIVWGILSIHSGQLLDFPASLTGFMASINTLILGAQNLNKREETKQVVATK